MVCPYCNQESTNTIRFCPHCGRDVTVAPPGPPPAPPRPATPGVPVGAVKKSNTGVIAIAVIGALLLIGVIVLIVILLASRGSDGGSQPVGGNVSVDAGDKTRTQLRFVTSDVSDYPTVRLYFSVEDDNGDPVLLTSTTAAIKEQISGGGEVERTIRTVEQLDKNQGLGIDILIDKSGSMETDFPQMQSILRTFINSLDYASGDKAELIAFDDLIMYMCTYTDDPSLLQGGISNMTPDGATALYDALYMGINNAGSRPGANCVIAFTDGEDNESIHTYSEVIALAQNKDVPVYLIGTDDADAGVLENIATGTGGKYWNVGAISDVSDILSEIYTIQKDMYCIEYDSDPGADPYAARNVSCTITDDFYFGDLTGVPFTAVPVFTVQPHTARYEIIAADISWTEASDLCISRGGHLATITSQAEMEQVSALAENSGLKYLWIGGYTSIRNNAAYGHWITGEDFSYSAWYPGEPSRNDRDGTPEAYLMLWRVEGVWSWNDQRNDVDTAARTDTRLKYFIGKMGYVCEYED
ncbi:MAG: VWA domain-containing protein [Clostridia bacterium]|nr:VWA domain-containing protein [Clostridia bacterium]